MQQRDGGDSKDIPYQALKTQNVINCFCLRPL